MQKKYPESIYPKEVVIKSAFRFLDRAYIHVDKQGSDYIINITDKENTLPISEGEFDNEMISQAARYVISVKTKNIRELTIGRALASTIIEDDSIPQMTESTESIDEILKDWFDND